MWDICTKTPLGKHQTIGEKSSEQALEAAMSRNYTPNKDSDLTETVRTNQTPEDADNRDNGKLPGDMLGK